MAATALCVTYCPPIRARLQALRPRHKRIAAIDRGANLSNSSDRLSDAWLFQASLEPRYVISGPTAAAR